MQSTPIAQTLEEIVHGLPAFLAERAAILLKHSADPPSVYSGLAALKQRHPDAFQRLIHSPAGLQFLIAVFSHSRFLSEEVLQHPEWIDQFRASGDLHRVLSADELRAKLDEFLAGARPNALSLATFRRKQILRILIRDVLAYATLSEVAEELSHLADSIVETAYQGIFKEFAAKFGFPRDGAGAPVGFSVIALGKMGGEELNYSSDIDLLFLYGANGSTEGGSASGESLTNKEFYKRVANELTQTLSTYTPEGLCYRVDLRLRPEGKLGEVCISLEGAERYYSTRARDWELQMMIKARVAAGDPSPGKELLEFVEPLTYSTSLDFSAIETMSVTRLRLNEKLAAKKLASSATAIDVKLAPGGIRDIEFLVQCLQRLHGGRVPWVRHGGTMLALSRLQDKNLLSPIECGNLQSAYQFLRHLEHRLQFDEDRQTHTLPSDPHNLAVIAARMPQATYSDEPVSAETLLERLKMHFAEVKAIYRRVVHTHQAPQPPTPVSEARDAAPRKTEETSPAGQPPQRLRQPFDVFRDRIGTESDLWRTLERDPVLMRFAQDLFELSPYFSEQLIRDPGLLIELQQMKESSPGFISKAPDASTVRRAFQREMFRLQAKGICLGAPVFETLAETSELADRILSEVYSLAVRETVAARPPENPQYRPADQLMVIALGRLGMREFDVASDADLVFVLPDADAPELLFWTNTASRIVDILTAYTGEGTLFAVDTRLRPNGREGALVQTVATFRDYFERHAEAWEGIAYMKALTVAGNLISGENFLHDLQELDWRRYGQSGRSKSDLRHMRMRLEREQGGENPIKAGFGGFYDIDFLLLYLRLKAAGFFFPVLNTPERIDIIEKMGHLDREDAAFLREAAAFYRALDHGLRVATGHVEGRLPNSEGPLALLTELVARSMPGRNFRGTLAQELARIQAKTRELFDRHFA